MTDKPDRDGILDPRASESVAKPPEIEAFDRWAPSRTTWPLGKRRGVGWPTPQGTSTTSWTSPEPPC